MYKIAIITNDSITVKKITTKILKAFNNHSVDPKITTYNDIQPLNLNTYYDMLIIDNYRNITFAKKYRQKHLNTHIIFIANNHDFLYIQPINEIKQNHLQSDCYPIINHLTHKTNHHNNVLLIQTKSDLITIKHNQIIYCQSQGHTSYIYTTKTTVTTRYKLSQLETMLNSKDFHLINQSYLINWHFVYQIKNKDVFLTNGTILHISRRKYKQAIASYQKYLITR